MWSGSVWARTPVELLSVALAVCFCSQLSCGDESNLDAKRRRNRAPATEQEIGAYLATFRRNAEKASEMATLRDNTKGGGVDAHYSGPIDAPATDWIDDLIDSYEPEADEECEVQVVGVPRGAPPRNPLLENEDIPYKVAFPQWAEMSIGLVVAGGCPSEVDSKLCSVEVYENRNTPNAGWYPAKRRIRYRRSYIAGYADEQTREFGLTLTGVLAHEYGHYLDYVGNRVFPRRFLDRHRELGKFINQQDRRRARVQLREMYADSVAGCVLARSGLDAEPFEAYLCGTDWKAETNYPTVEARRQALLAGWRDCGGTRKVHELMSHEQCKSYQPPKE